MCKYVAVALVLTGTSCRWLSVWRVRFCSARTDNRRIWKAQSRRYRRWKIKSVCSIRKWHCRMLLTLLTMHACSVTSMLSCCRWLPYCNRWCSCVELVFFEIIWMTSYCISKVIFFRIHVVEFMYKRFASARQLHKKIHFTSTRKKKTGLTVSVWALKSTCLCV